MTLLWILLIVTFIFSAIFMLPTRWYTAMADWLRGFSARRHQQQFTRELARQSQGRPFALDKSFFADGVGLALDFNQRLLFIATHEEGGLKSIICPFPALKTHSRGERRDNGFYDYYVELTLDDPAHPIWRLVCGENPELAAQIAAVLDEVKA
jgi:hypothetical protein